MNGNQEYKYEVCLSYAGEDREFVDGVAKELKRQNVKVFYDQDNEVDAWGKNLYEYLHSVYYKESRYCVIFISTHYEKKWWPINERRFIQARAFEGLNEYILPYKIDDTILPGEIRTTGYISDKSCVELANIIMLKIGKKDIELLPLQPKVKKAKYKYWYLQLLLSLMAIAFVFYLVNKFYYVPSIEESKVKTVYLKYSNLDLGDRNIKFARFRINGKESFYNFSKSFPGSILSFDSIPIKHYLIDSADIILVLSDMSEVYAKSLIIDTIILPSLEVSENETIRPIDSNLIDIKNPKELILEGRVLAKTFVGIAGVKVSGSSNTSVISNESGYFKLVFLKKSKGERVEISFEKEGYEGKVIGYRIPKSNVKVILKKGHGSTK